MRRPAPRPGIIGLGMIGGGIAVSLARSGQVPAVFDVRVDATSALDGVPAQLNSPADVARDSDVVIIAVLTAEQDLDAAHELARELTANLPIASVVRPMIGDIYRGRLSDPLPIAPGGHK